VFLLEEIINLFFILEIRKQVKDIIIYKLYKNGKFKYRRFN
jgi:hypothetical protein